MASEVYSTARWRDVRAQALERDGSRCTVARLLGGPCSLDVHVHHIEAVAEGGAPYELANLATVCSSHHPIWEAVRRAVVRARRRAEPDYVEPCRAHSHRSFEARLLCARNRLRKRGIDAEQLALVKTA